MTERIRRLREESVNTAPYISTERAELLTKFYESGVPERVSAPVGRALAFQYVMQHKTIWIGPGELIVGERGPAPKATPTYPELCCHSLEDLSVMARRERTRFDVSPQVRRTYEERTIPFWAGRTMRDRVFEAMSPEWMDAFEAGVFTEFMEQRAPGHAVLGDVIYRRGFRDLKEDIRRTLGSLDLVSDPRAHDKREELRAMAICADALVSFANRHAALAKDLAAVERDPGRRVELERIAEVCSHVPEHAPRDFWEALQAYWFVHLGVITELNTWDSFCPGRLDQHLYPFYAAGLADGSLTRESAMELLECFWIKFNNQPAPPKVGVTEEQSGTYTDFALINLGGLRPDGSDAVNDLTYLLLDVIEEMRLVQPSSCIQVSKKSPDAFVDRAARIIRTGFGQPSVFNTEAIIQELLRAGKTVEDARAGGASGCVEVAAFGKESCTLTGYLNWPKILEITLNDGLDPRTGKLIGIATGDPRLWTCYEDMLSAYRRQLQHFVDLKVAGNNIIERLFARHLPAPFMSLLIEDCIAKATDYHDGGARYNTTYVQGVGLGTLTDAMAAVKHHVFTERSVTMEELLHALAVDFEGLEPLRQSLANRSPRYGNDDDAADDVARDVFEAYFGALDGRPNTKGGQYHINLLPTTVHVYFGSLVGALPNGRRAGVALSDGISPSQGADWHGPTAVIRSAAKLDHVRTGGTLLNQRFTPSLLETEDGLRRLRDLVRAYFMLDGHHIQFNVVSSETLRAAQADPAAHRDLIVRVAGYSDYFTELGRDLQNEVIARTEHRGF